GAFGGSLGYSCANNKDVSTSNPDGSDGLYGAYIGLGIDEFGNFSNSGDTTNTGPGQGWNRVTLRGAGNINWKWLSENKASYYPSSILNTRTLQNNAVKQACLNGKLYRYTKSGSNVTNTEVANTGTNYSGFYNYPYIIHSDIMDAKLISSDSDNARKQRKAIFNQQAINMPLRGAATPITYNIKITQDGLLSFAYSYNGGESIQVMDKRDITASNGPLPKNF
ncbi:MAG: pilus assembly protein PilY, partial [Comamonas sp.]